MAAFGSGLFEHLVHDRAVRGAERGTGLEGPARDHVPSALGVSEPLERPRFADPGVGRVAILRPSPQTLLPDIGKRRLLGAVEQALLGFGRDRRRRRDRFGLRSRQLPRT